jgi:chorismate mutase
MSLEKFRSEIDEIDQSVLDLLNRRVHLAAVIVS